MSPARPSRPDPAAGRESTAGALRAAVGGPRGALESVGPTLAFLVAVTASAPVRLAGVVAVGVSLVLVLARALARLPLSPAVSGGVLVVVSALLALRSGRASGFYLLGLVLDAVYGVVLAASTLPLPRTRRSSAGAVPLVGVALALLRQAGWRWRADAGARRLAVRLTWLWVAMFAVRLVVEGSLYAAGASTALGVARLGLGVPLFALVVWVSWAAVRDVPAFAPPADQPDRPDQPDQPDQPDRPDRLDAR